jgi:hypothetical protein
MKFMLAGMLVALISFGSQVQARDVNSLASEVAQVLSNEFRAQQLDFKKGDFAKYDMNVGSFIKGKMEMNILDVSAEGIWLQQFIDLGFAGKQDVRQLIDPNTGEIKKYIVNGKEQAPPERGDIEIIEQKEDTVQVPAGRFICVYIKANIQAQGQKAVAEQWINPREVAVMGLVKMVTQTQLGPMTAVLTSFKKN